MTLYEELIERGLIAQVTNEEEISKMINEGKATFYIGFDPTADSLHVGHFMALCLMKRLQMAGNKPIALLGGGTGMIGDPSGKTDMRKMLTKEDIEHNIACFKKQMSRFIDFSDGKALLVNNADWLREKAITVAEEMLQTNDEIDLFLALNDPMAEGAYIAAKNAGKEGDILFVGFDGLPTPDGGIRSVMDGRLSMTQVYPTGGTEAIESAYQLLVEGKELDKTLTLTSEIVVPDNAEELLAKYGGSAE